MHIVNWSVLYFYMNILMYQNYNKRKLIVMNFVLILAEIEICTVSWPIDNIRVVAN